MKKIILLVLITLALSNGYSQEKGKFRVGLDIGYVPTGGGGGGNRTSDINSGINSTCRVPNVFSKRYFFPPAFTTIKSFEFVLTAIPLGSSKVR